MRGCLAEVTLSNVSCILFRNFLCSQKFPNCLTSSWKCVTLLATWLAFHAHQSKIFITQTSCWRSGEKLQQSAFKRILLAFLVIVIYLVIKPSAVYILRAFTLDSLSWLTYIIIGYLHDGVFLLPSSDLECFVKVLSYSNFSSLLGLKTQLEKLAKQIKLITAFWSWL